MANKFILLGLFFILPWFFHAIADEPDDALRSRAITGDLAAQLELGGEFFHGTPKRKKNLSLAFYYFRMASRQNSAEGHFNTATCYEQGFGTERNLNLALSHYLAAAQGGLAVAAYKTGIIYQAGIPDAKNQTSMPPNREQALFYYRMAADKDFTPAKIELYLLELDSPTPPDAKIAMTKLEFLEQNLAESDGRGWRKLADFYYAGVSGERNQRKMFECLQKSAAAGDPEGWAKLGYAYQYGEGVAPDAKAALTAFGNAAQANHPGAIAKMGEYYLEGIEVEQNLPLALTNFKIGADAGSPVALYQLARCLLNGWGVEADAVQALPMLFRAAALDEVRAQILLGKVLEAGKDLPKDSTGARYWFRRAGLSGNPEGIRLYAFTLLASSPEEARLLLIQAAEMGDVESALWLNSP